MRFFFGVKNRSEDEDEENLRLSEATKLKQRDLGVWEKQREERGTEAIDNWLKLKQRELENEKEVAAAVVVVVEVQT